jgi:hypothetical protein
MHDYRCCCSAVQANSRRGTSSFYITFAFIIQWKD